MSRACLSASATSTAFACFRSASGRGQPEPEDSKRRKTLNRPKAPRNTPKCMCAPENAYA
eukprot:9858615-Alexandrium_andersonii.AAC.2